MIGPIKRIALALAALMALGVQPAAADKRDSAVDLVDRAAETLAYFSADSAYEPMWSLADDAKAIVVVPRSIRAGFIFGGSGGNAVMIARNKDGTWSQPAFYTIGSASFGFQAGAEFSEIVLLVMTQRGMERLLSTSFKLGADASIAAGPIGAGAKAQTTDILAFSRSRGLYGGLSLEGAVVKTRQNLNRAYYNADVRGGDIVFRGDVYNPASANLQTAAWKLANRDASPLLAPATAQPQPQPNPYAPQPLSPGQPQPNAYGQPSLPPAPTYEDDAVWGAPIGKDD